MPTLLFCLHDVQGFCCMLGLIIRIIISRVSIGCLVTRNGFFPGISGGQKWGQLDFLWTYVSGARILAAPMMTSHY